VRMEQELLPDPLGILNTMTELGMPESYRVE
jgi:hypothetical protein